MKQVDEIKVRGGLAKVGNAVTVISRGHRQDGKTGVVSYIRSTIGVSFDGDTYGFMPSELSIAEALA